MKRFSDISNYIVCYLWLPSDSKPCSGGQMPLSLRFMQTRPLLSAAWHQRLKKVQITGDFFPTKKIDTPMGKYDMPE